MATSFSTNLALALPATGELSGTWGTTVNSNITNMLDEALGYQAFSATGGSDTLTIPDGTTGVARSIYIQLNGTGGGTVNVPTTKTKMYFVFNNTASAITFKVTGQTGVSIPAAAKIALVSNGTDIIVAQNYFSALTLGAALPVASGGTALTAGTSGGVLAYTASGTLASSGALTASALVLGGGAGATPTPMGSLGTTTTVLHGNAGGAPTFGAVSLTADVSGTLPIANGGTGTTSTTFTNLTTNVTGTLPIANGGTGTTSTTFVNLATNVTGNLPTTNLNSGTSASASTFWRGDGAWAVPSGTSSGSVTSVAGTGTVNGISLSGTVTTSGSLTLGGTLSGVGLTTQVTGILPVANGGTATATPALVQGSGVTITGTWPNQTINATGTGGTVTAVSVVSTNGFAGSSSGGATPALTLSTSITGVLKGNGTTISAAVAGTDYVTPTGTETLTNKTIAYASNTLTDVVGVTATQTLTNKTLTAPTIASANLTTALTLAGAAGTNGQVLTSAGSGLPSWTTPGGGFTTMSASTSSGTFTIPTGITVIKVTVVGGGGGGGAGQSNDGVNGGDSTLASGTQVITTITGGGGGKGSTDNTGRGGTGGTSTNGTLNITGGTGTATAVAMSGTGGSSAFGGGGRAGNFNGPIAGGAGGAYGAGGGGGGAGGSAYAGTGGGGGGTAIIYLTGLTPGNTFTVTVGTGGAGGSASGGGLSAGGAGAAGVVIFEY